MEKSSRYFSSDRSSPFTCGVWLAGDKKDSATKDKNPSSVDAIKKRGEIKIAVFGDLSHMVIWMPKVKIKATMSILAIKSQKI